MKNTLLAGLGLLLLCSCCFALGKTAAEPKVCIQLHTADHLMVGIDNRISIVAEQGHPVELDQVRISSTVFIDPETTGGDAGATIKKEGESFVVRVDTLSEVAIQVQTQAGVVEHAFIARPVPAVPKFGNFYGGAVKAGAFKAQKGMIAWVECCGFDARCEVLDYSLVRITKANRVARAFNQGGTLNKATAKLVQAAASGDIYWFRNIRYACHRDGAPQWGEDISIEIE